MCQRARRRPDPAPEGIQPLLEPARWCDPVPGLWQQPEAQLGAVREGLAVLGRANGQRQPVEDDRHKDDAHAGFEGPSDLELEQRLVDFAPQTAGTDKGGQHRQPQRHHDGLIDAQHDRGHGLRDLYLGHGLQPGRAETLRHLDRGLGHLPDAQIGKTHHRRHRVDDDGHRRPGVADTEQKDRRQQIDEGRHGLHSVEHRPDGGLNPVVLRTPDPERDAQQHRNHHRHTHERQGRHRRIPHVDSAPEHDPDHGQQRQPQTAEPQPEQPERDDHQRPGPHLQEIFDLTDPVGNDLGDGAGGIAHVGLEPVLADVDPVDEIDARRDGFGETVLEAEDTVDEDRHGQCQHRPSQRGVVHAVDDQQAPQRRAARTRSDRCSHDPVSSPVISTQPEGHGSFICRKAEPHCPRKGLDAKNG